MLILSRGARSIFLRAKPSSAPGYIAHWFLGAFLSTRADGFSSFSPRRDGSAWGDEDEMDDDCGDDDEEELPESFEVDEEDGS